MKKHTEYRVSMTLNLPESEMLALKRLQHQTGITRTELVRSALKNLFEEHLIEIDMKAINRPKPIEKNPRAKQQHYREYHAMPLHELYPVNKIGVLR